MIALTSTYALHAYSRTPTDMTQLTASQSSITTITIPTALCRTWCSTDADQDAIIDMQLSVMDVTRYIVLARSL